MSAVILQAAGASAAPIPLAETLLARWALTRAGIAPPDGPLSLSFAGAVTATQKDDQTWQLSGSLSRVPWAAQAVSLVIVTDAVTALVPGSSFQTSGGKNLAGEPRDDLDLDRVDAKATPGFSVEEVRFRAALCRAAMMRGTLERVLALTVQYAGERKQFGRTLSKFQVLQHDIARMAGHVATVSAAGEAAARTGEPLAIAAAKARAGLAAGEVAATSHQVHGAIGFTYEHRLHHFTKRLWSWRDEDGSDAYWRQWLGERVVAGGADGLWPMLTAV
jgi:alkylation response protein AidB-like acyl-CoA dehydrogenase